MAVRLASNGRLLRTVRGSWADERTDHTARLQLDGLAPGRRYDATICVHLRRRRDRPDRAGQLQHCADPRGGDVAGRGPATPAARGSGSTRSSAGSRRTARCTRPARTSSCTAATRSTPTSRSRRASRRRAATSGATWSPTASRRSPRRLDGVPRPAPLPAAGQQRPCAVRRRADDRAVGRPRDLQQLVPGRASSTTTATPSAAATCSPPAAAAPGRSTSRCRCSRLRRPRRRRLRVRRGSTAGSRAVRTSTCSASTCAPTAAPTTPSASGQPGILGPSQEQWLIEAVIAVAGDLEGDLRRPAALDPVRLTTTTSTARATATTASRWAASRSSPGSSRRVKRPG